MTEFKTVTDEDLLRATLFNRCRLSETGCWIWTAKAKDSGGYGLFYLDYKNKKAHRVSYELFKGPIPDGMHILHSCDNPACVNPDHLRAGTVKENMQDREARGRRDVRGEQIGTSKLTEKEAMFVKITDAPIKLLSEVFGISEGYLYRVRNGQSWAHQNAAALWTRLNAASEGVNHGN
jgi:hypothetical protein